MSSTAPPASSHLRARYDELDPNRTLGCGFCEADAGAGAAATRYLLETAARLRALKERECRGFVVCVGRPRVSRILSEHL